MPPKSDNNRKTRSHSHTLDDPSENKGDNMAVFEGTGNTPEVLANTESKGATTNNDDLRHLIQQLSTTVRTSNSNIQSSIDQLSRKIDDQHATFSAELRELRTSLTDAQAEISDLKSTNQRRQTVIANLERDQTRSQQSIRTLNCQVQRMKCALTKQETYSRKQNIVIDGLREDENDDLENKLRNLFTNILNLNVAISDLDKFHRIGTANKDKPRPVLVRCMSQGVRDSILVACPLLKGKNIYVSEDLPAETRRQRADLRLARNHAASLGKEVSLKGDFLYIEGIKYTYDSLSSLPVELNLREAQTVRIAPDKLGYHNRHQPLSNFFLCDIVGNDGHIYCCAEQYFQVKKVEFFNRDDLKLQILAAEDPVSMKRLGDIVKPPKGSPWHVEKDKIMKSVVLSKLEQNPSIAKYLLSTGSAQLIEATHHQYWGAGCGAKDSALFDGSFKGKNIMGGILAEVRTQLKKT